MELESALTFEEHGSEREQRISLCANDSIGYREAWHQSTNKESFAEWIEKKSHCNLVKSTEGRNELQATVGRLLLNQTKVSSSILFRLS